MNIFKVTTFWIAPIVCSVVVGLFYLMGNYDMFFKSLGVSLLFIVTISLIYNRFAEPDNYREIEKPFEDI